MRCILQCPGEPPARAPAHHHPAALRRLPQVGLNVYQNSRSALGFSGFLADCNAALLVLSYAVETTVLVGTASSSARYFNTQHSQQKETLTVSISDQGNTGKARVAESASVVVPVTVVAVNNPPVIRVDATELAVLEDTALLLEGLSVSDVDVEEKIVSSLASLDWMNKAEFRLTINAMSCSLRVAKGRLFLSYTSNLNVLFTRRVYGG